MTIATVKSDKNPGVSLGMFHDAALLFTFGRVVAR